MRRAIRTDGKTLLELLMVVAIIALLMGLILSGGLWVRGYAKRASCASNLRQLYVAIQSYVQDYQEPPPLGMLNDQRQLIDYWTVLAQYQPSVQSVYLCPSDIYEGRKTKDGNPQAPPFVSYVAYYHYVDRSIPLVGVDAETAEVYRLLEQIDPNNPDEIFFSCDWHAPLDGRIWAVFADGRIGWAYMRYCEADGRRYYYYRPIELTEEQCRKLLSH